MRDESQTSPGDPPEICANTSYFFHSDLESLDRLTNMEISGKADHLPTRLPPTSRLSRLEFLVLGVLTFQGVVSAHAHTSKSLRVHVD